MGLGALNSSREHVLSKENLDQLFLGIGNNEIETQIFCIITFFFTETHQRLS